MVSIAKPLVILLFVKRRQVMYKKLIWESNIYYIN